MQEITRSQTVAKIHNYVFLHSECKSFRQTVKETHHMSEIQEALFGRVTSVDLLNKIYEKGLQNIFSQTCIAIKMFITLPVSVAGGNVHLVNSTYI